MKCEEKVGKYCRQAISYAKYAKYRECNKCCLKCSDKCDNVCDKAKQGGEGC